MAIDEKKNVPVETQEFGTLYMSQPTQEPPASPLASQGGNLTGNNHNNGSNGLGVSLKDRQNQSGGAMGSPTQTQPQTPNGMTGIRQGLNNAGINDSRIDWTDDGYVTIDGQRAYKPDVNIDGTTYASQSTINDMARRAYANQGNPLMAAREYVHAAQLGDIVDWDNESGTVNIGGTVIKPTYVSDGIAYIPRSVLDDAIRSYRQRSGIETPNETLNRYNQRWDEPTQRALDRVINRREFSYDPDTDPMFRQYMTEREREADLNFRKTLNANNTSVYGASGAVLSEAAAQRANALRDIAEAQRTYRNDAYGRYTDDYDMRRQALNSLMGVSGEDYDREYRANADAYERATGERKYYDDRMDTTWEQDQAARTNDLLREGYGIGNRSAAAQADVNRMYADRYPEILDSEVTSGKLANDLSQLNLDATKQDYIWDKGTRFNYWTAADGAVVPELFDLYKLDSTGRYFVDDNGNRVHPQDFALDYAKRQRYEDAYYGGLGTIDAKLGTRRYN